jgi:putative ABC transport system permease protein
LGRLLLVCRLVARDLRHRPAQAVLLLLAITAATSVLTLGLALRGVSRAPYAQTRAATRGPDVVAQLGGPAAGPHGPGAAKAEPQVQAQVKALIHAPGVTGHSGPYPVASAVLRAGGLTAAAEVEGRAQAPASLEQPKVTAGGWVRPGGLVLERTFAEALGVTAGDKVTLNGRRFTVAGIAVTAASPPYPNLCYWPGGGTCGVFDLQDAQFSPGDIGLAWGTQRDARALASSAAPLWYFLNLKLRDPGRARAFASAYDSTGPGTGGPTVIPWPSIAAADGLLVQAEQQVLMPGSWVAGLLALAAVTVLAGGRMAERTRRVGLLKAVGSTLGLVGAVLLAENLVLGLLAAAAGLAAGWLAAPLLTNPGAALVGTPGAPSLTPSIAGEVVAVALVVALAATAVPALRAARTSTVSALANAARPPRRRGALIAASARLPVPLLLGLRLAARRPRRALLSAASIAVTVSGIVAVLAYHATAGQKRFGGSDGLSNPVVDRDTRILLVLTVVLVALAVLNAVITTWATVLDASRTSALARALGSTPRQVSAGLSAAQVIPALPGAILGIPLGIGLFAVANGAGVVTIPPASWLLAAVLSTLAAVAALTNIPARVGARRSVAEVLQSETA